MRRIFLAGGTGYLGRPLIQALLERGHQVRALVRSGSEGRLPSGCVAVPGDPLEEESWARLLPPADTLVQLVGTSRPAPWKADQFRRVDLQAVRAAVVAAVQARIEHFVYVSVAQPAPLMKAYVRVRAECEERIHSSGLNATILRPWYVLGPGRRWPHLLRPFYWLFERFPGTRETAWRLGLVTREEMLQALLQAVENPARGVRIMEVPGIRAAGARRD